MWGGDFKELNLCNGRFCLLLSASNLKTTAALIALINIVTTDRVSCRSQNYFKLQSWICKMAKSIFKVSFIAKRPRKKPGLFVSRAMTTLYPKDLSLSDNCLRLQLAK